MPQTPVPDAGLSSVGPSHSITPHASDASMPSEDESSDSETVRMTLQYSGPQIPGPGILSCQHPAEIAPNAPIDDIDTPMHPPPDDETPLLMSSVESQPNTASGALQQIHDYIDSQLINLVGVAVEKAVGTSYNELADSINKEIGSIKNQVFQPTRDEDDPMSPQDQQNDNPADDDESEEHNGNCRRHGQNQQNQHRSNCHKRQQMVDDDDEDESDNGAIHGRRKTPVIFSVRDYLPQFSHEPNADIVCTPCISSTEGADS